MRKNFLFAEADEEILQKLLKEAKIIEFAPKQHIFYETGKNLGIILSGKAEVKQNGFILRILESGDSFGIATLFSAEEDEISALFAKGRTMVAFISAEFLLLLFQDDFSLVKRYIAFQADRIRYLNQRLGECTGNSTLAKTAAYLYHSALSQNSLSPTLKLNMTQLSAALSMGRASLYRAIGKLEADEIISRNNDEISIKNLDALAKIFKSEEC